MCSIEGVAPTQFCALFEGMLLLVEAARCCKSQCVGDVSSYVYGVDYGNNNHAGIETHRDDNKGNESLHAALDATRVNHAKENIDTKASCF